MRPEGQFELVGDLRPELAQHVPPHVVGHAEGHTLRGGAETSRIIRMIEIRYQLGGYGGRPLGVVEDELARIAGGHEAVLERMNQAASGSTAANTVVARVLMKDGGIEKHPEEISGRIVGRFRRQTFTETGGALSVAGIAVLELAYPCIPCAADKVDGINAVVYEESKLLAHAE